MLNLKMMALLLMFCAVLLSSCTSVPTAPPPDDKAQNEAIVESACALPRPLVWPYSQKHVSGYVLTLKLKLKQCRNVAKGALNV